MSKNLIKPPEQHPARWCWCGLPTVHANAEECLTAWRERYAELEMKVEKLEKLSLIDKQGRDYGGGATPEREATISEFLASDARKYPGVMEFRRTVLRGRLLKLDAQVIAHWVARQKKRDHGPELTGTVLLPKGHSLETAPRDAPIIKLSRVSLRYPGEGFYARSIPIPHNGILDQLRKLGESLSLRYSWSAAEAVAFVLTDWTPVVRQVTAEFSRNLLVPLLNRIHITVDPAVSPRELQAIYRKMRRENAGHAREISDKRMRLAAFCAARPASQTYSVMMKAWNKAHREYRYGQVSNFGRDAREAVKTVLGLDFKAQKGATK